MNRYRKYRIEEEDDQGSWIVSYADLTSLLLGFFIILFAFSSIDEKKFDQFSREIQSKFAGKESEAAGDQMIETDGDRRQLRAMQLLVSMLNLGTTEEVVNKIEIASKTGEEQTMLREKFEAISEGIPTKNLVNVGNLLERDSVVEIIIPSQALFVSGSDQLTKAAETKLKEVSSLIVSIQDLVGVEVRGHTDSVAPRGGAKFSSNWALSAARAGAVASYLVAMGLERDRVTTSGLADLKPLFPELTPDGTVNAANRAKNRRVEIVVKRRQNP